MIEVVAALIWDKDKFLICQRPENKARGLLWEYVGGKVEAGETKQEALIRECKEELDVMISVEKGPPTRCNLGGERRSRDARSRHTNRICLPSTADDDAFMDVVHEYPDITVHLTLFHAQIVSGEIRLLEHNAVAWITPDEIPNYAFCPADKEINERIAAEYGNTLFHTGDNG